MQLAYFEFVVRPMELISKNKNCTQEIVWAIMDSLPAKAETPCGRFFLPIYTFFLQFTVNLYIYTPPTNVIRINTHTYVAYTYRYLLFSTTCTATNQKLKKLTSSYVNIVLQHRIFPSHIDILYLYICTYTYSGISSAKYETFIVNPFREITSLMSIRFFGGEETKTKLNSEKKMLS